MSVRMGTAEREAFLAEVRVGVLAVTGPADRAPLIMPVWYSYSPGGRVCISTGRASRKTKSVAEAGRCSLCAQDETPPYRYVSVEGPAVIEPISDAERLAMACRYLGTEDGDAFMAANLQVDDIAIRMTPEVWQSADFSKSAD